MAFYKITYSELFERANVYNYGCNFNCSWCSYKLKGHEEPKEFLTLDQVRKTLSDLDITRVHFMGGEPTAYPGLARIADFAKNELGVYTKIGHSTGFNMPPDNIDAMSISIKCLSERTHMDHTGVSNIPVLRNFKRIHEIGVEIDASSVLIPGLIGLDEIDRISSFIAGIDRNIPYHIVGYVPVPGPSWRGPTPAEVEEAKGLAQRYLEHVTSSCLSPTDFMNLADTDIRYQSARVA